MNLVIRLLLSRQGRKLLVQLYRNEHVRRFVRRRVYDRFKRGSG